MWLHHFPPKVADGYLTRHQAGRDWQHGHIRQLNLGDSAVTVWSLPGGASGRISVELLTLPGGEESIEVVQRGQPEGYRCVTWSNIEALVATEDASISRHGNEVVMRYAIKDATSIVQ